jgi:flavin reductase (DIM6/NTAB) family NADH-FMN oxidoreductase RutF
MAGADEPDLNRTFSTIMGGLDSPVVIVTADNGREKSGCLVGFFSACSIHPPRVMVWISKENRTFDVAADAGTIAVHFVDRDHYELAKLFATVSGDDVDKFTLCRWRRGVRDAVILEGCARWVVGRVLGRCDGGDHEGFLVEPVDAAAGAWPGQLGFQSVKDLEAGHPA